MRHEHDTAPTGRHVIFQKVKTGHILWT